MREFDHNGLLLAEFQGKIRRIELFKPNLYQKIFTLEFTKKT